MSGRKRTSESGSRKTSVGVRLDPRSRFAAELAAAKERRTLSNFIEWAVEQAVTRIPVAGDKSASEVAADVWHDDESTRFLRTAAKFQELLNFDEKEIWRVIKQTPDLHIDEERIDGSLVRAHFDTIKRVAKGKADIAVLKKEINEAAVKEGRTGTWPSGSKS